MLLRAGIIYALAVICLLFAALAAWQRLEIFANSENLTMLAERAERLQGELDAAVLASRSAERRAMVAEDSLARQSAFNVSDGRYLNEARENLAATLSAKAAADLARTRLEADLAAAVSERDAARREALALSAGVGEAQRAVKAAEDAADLAEQKLEAANTQMSRVPPTASSGSPGTIDPGGSLQRDGKAAVETGSLPPQEGQSTSTGTSTSATSTSESTAKAETPPPEITPDVQAAPSSAPQHAGPEQTGPQPGSGPAC
ncbi:MAG: hypothetical protein ABL907_23875 [Hyphomicrobium sp.]